MNCAWILDRYFLCHCSVPFLLGAYCYSWHCLQCWKNLKTLKMCFLKIKKNIEKRFLIYDKRHTCDNISQ